MARWVWPAAAGVVTSATGVVINVATDLKTEPWSWVLVVLLTGLGVVVAMRMQPTPAPPPEPTPVSPPEPTPVAPPPARGGVHNSLSGVVNGNVVQIGSVGRYNDNSVTQKAIVRDNGTVHQAGRDIRSDDED